MFEDYPFGERYRDAHLSKVDLPQDLMEKINEWFKKQKGIFTFVGTPGTGKTYVCAAIYNALKEKYAKHPHFVARVFKEEKYFSDLRNIIKQDWDYEVEINKIAEADYIFMDDLSVFKKESNIDWRKEVLFSLLDKRYSNHKPMIITSNSWLKEMQKIMGERFISRLRDKDNLVIELNWIDKRQQKE